MASTISLPPLDKEFALFISNEKIYQLFLTLLPVRILTFMPIDINSVELLLLTENIVPIMDRLSIINSINHSGFAITTPGLCLDHQTSDKLASLLFNTRKEIIELHKNHQKSPSSFGIDEFIEKYTNYLKIVSDSAQCTESFLSQSAKSEEEEKKITTNQKEKSKTSHIDSSNYHSDFFYYPQEMNKQKICKAIYDETGGEKNLIAQDKLAGYMNYGIFLWSHYKSPVLFTITQQESSNHPLPSQKILPLYQYYNKRASPQSVHSQGTKNYNFSSFTNKRGYTPNEAQNAGETHLRAKKEREEEEEEEAQSAENIFSRLSSSIIPRNSSSNSSSNSSFIKKTPPLLNNNIPSVKCTFMTIDKNQKEDFSLIRAEPGSHAGKASTILASRGRRGEATINDNNEIEDEELVISSINQKCISNIRIEMYALNYNLAMFYLKKFVIEIKTRSVPLFNELKSQSDRGDNTIYLSTLKLLHEKCKTHLDFCIEIHPSIADIINNKSFYSTIKSNYKMLFDIETLKNISKHVLNFFGQVLMFIKAFIKLNNSVDTNNIKKVITTTSIIPITAVTTTILPQQSSESDNYSIVPMKYQYLLLSILMYIESGIINDPIFIDTMNIIFDSSSSLFNIFNIPIVLGILIDYYSSYLCFTGYFKEQYSKYSSERAMPSVSPMFDDNLTTINNQYGETLFFIENAHGLLDSIIKQEVEAPVSPSVTESKSTNKESENSMNNSLFHKLFYKGFTKNLNDVDEAQSAKNISDFNNPPKLLHSPKVQSNTGDNTAPTISSLPSSPYSSECAFLKNLLENTKNIMERVHNDNADIYRQSKLKPPSNGKKRRKIPLGNINIYRYDKIYLSPTSDDHPGKDSGEARIKARMTSE
jgi:hypothetical protein